MRNRIILGAGLKVTQTCDLFNIVDEISQYYEVPRFEGETKSGAPILDTIIQDKENFLKLKWVHDMHGNCREKRDTIEKFLEEAKKKRVPFGWGRLIHPLTVFANPKHLGEDIIIRPFSVIGSNAVLGDHVDIGNLSNIGHHCIIGDYSIIAGQVAMSGSVTLGEGVSIGQGASIKPGITIGKGSVVGTGAAVVKDVPPNTVVAGNPAKPSKKFKPVTPW